MRILICLAILLAADVANAQTATVEHKGNTVTVTGNGYTITRTQISKSANSATYTTTITKNGGGYQPMGSGGGYHPTGAGGYHPMGH